MWKRYQGGWGGGLQLHLPCPMPPSAVAAGPVKKRGVRFRFLAVQRSATADRGLGQGKLQMGRSCPTPLVPFPGPRPAVQANRVPVPADWCVPYAPPPAPAENAALTLLTTNGPEHSSQGLYINQYYKTKRSTSWTSLIWCET